VSTPVDFEALRNALKKTFEKASGGLQTIVEDEDRPFMDPSKGAMVIFSTPRFQQIGVDEIRYQNDPTDPLKLVPAVVGNRRMRISVKVESMSQEPNGSAMFYAERIRTRLKFPSVVDIMRDAGVALIESLPTVSAPYLIDDRMRARAVLDLSFAVASCDLDEPIETIGSLEIASDTLDDISGTPVSIQINKTLTLP